MFVTSGIYLMAKLRKRVFGEATVVTVPSKMKKCKENSQSGYLTAVVFASDDKPKKPLCGFFGPVL